MVVGYLVGGKKYLGHQILLCILMTVGTILVISQGPALDKSVTVDWLFVSGIAVLTVASMLGAYMGIYTEKLYQNYGNHWQEVLFYTHFLGLPMFVFTGSAVVSDLRTLWYTVPLVPGIPRGIALLALNSVTQLVCALGVNSLAGIASSLTVAVILLMRKFVSLAISSYVYGTSFSAQGLFGSFVLIISTIYYTMVSINPQKEKKKKQA